MGKPLYHDSNRQRRLKLHGSPQKPDRPDEKRRFSWFGGGLKSFRLGIPDVAELSAESHPPLVQQTSLEKAELEAKTELITANASEVQRRREHEDRVTDVDLAIKVNKEITRLIENPNMTAMQKAIQARVLADAHPPLREQFEKLADQFERVDQAALELRVIGNVIGGKIEMEAQFDFTPAFPDFLPPGFPTPFPGAESSVAVEPPEQKKPYLPPEGQNEWPY